MFSTNKFRYLFVIIVQNFLDNKLDLHHFVSRVGTRNFLILSAIRKTLDKATTRIAETNSPIDHSIVLLDMSLRLNCKN